MKKRGIKSLSFKFTVIFAIFTVITLFMSGAVTYNSQIAIYREQCQANIRNISEYLCALMEDEGEETVAYQKYYMEHYKEMDIPCDVTEYKSYKKKFDELFRQKHPGKVLGKDVQVDKLEPELQKAYCIYKHIYWILTYEEAREIFHVPYTYYVVPTGTADEVVYLVDAVREPREKEKKYIELGITVPEDVVKYKNMWRAWDTGKSPEDFDTFDNDFGHTYAYYVPLVINGETLGVVCTDTEVASVDHDILMNTLKQMVMIAAVMVVCVILLILFINRRYILRIVHLANYVSDYKINRDPLAAKSISDDVKGKDELAELSQETASMIYSIENYIDNLEKTQKELKNTKDHASMMKELANKDALTGLRNKTAYDNEIKRLEWMIDDGTARFGIAMIDLNFLKRINDTYGHEQGNAAIKNLCRLVCTIFAHSPVFRIGGDEFVVILENGDYDDIELLLMDFNQKIEEYAQDDTLEPWEKISAAIGYAVYDKFIDHRVDNVFKRADKAMYQQKKNMKVVREN